MSSFEMEGKVVLITGATSGIGRVTAKALADKGAKVVIFGRNNEKGKSLLAEIVEDTGNKESEFIHCDLASMDEVKKAAVEFRSRRGRLDVLIDNAGGINGRRKETQDGFEYTFGVNHLAHFLLTNLLLAELKASAPSRVVVTSSSVHKIGHIDFGDLMAERSYGFMRAYSQSKLANALFTFELSRRLEGTEVTSNCYHPGMIRTNFIKGLGALGVIASPFVGLFEHSPAKGAATQIYLASSSEVEGITGEYFFQKKVERSSDESLDLQVAKKLWEVSEELTRPWI
jgi:NAD(P)-dependent dehydrogenase (short-subunit alcohol dehydrogenase family)